jgi:hypothetical protein
MNPVMSCSDPTTRLWPGPPIASHSYDAGNAAGAGCFRAKHASPYREGDVSRHTAQRPRQFLAELAGWTGSRNSGITTTDAE